VPPLHPAFPHTYTAPHTYLPFYSRVAPTFMLLFTFYLGLQLFVAVLVTRLVCFWCWFVRFRGSVTFNVWCYLLIGRGDGDWTVMPYLPDRVG
jgi:hypothetical protein